MCHPLRVLDAGGTLPVLGGTSAQSFPPPRLPCPGHTAAGAHGALARRPAALSGSHPANPSQRSAVSDFHLPARTKQNKSCHRVALGSRFICKRKKCLHVHCDGNVFCVYFSLLQDTQVTLKKALNNFQD